MPPCSQNGNYIQTTIYSPDFLNTSPFYSEVIQMIWKGFISAGVRMVEAPTSPDISRKRQSAPVNLQLTKKIRPDFAPTTNLGNNICNKRTKRVIVHRCRV
jgi:hypothetical protein